MSRPKIPSEFIVKLKGKEYVTYPGLLSLAHDAGITALVVEAVQFPTDENGNEAIMMATATTKDNNTFVEYGDASPKNVNSMIKNAVIRMAATRAKARALRDLTNVGITALEELPNNDGEDVGDAPMTPAEKKAAAAREAELRRKEAVLEHMGTIVAVCNEEYGISSPEVIRDVVGILLDRKIVDAINELTEVDAINAAKLIRDKGKVTAALDKLPVPGAA